MTDANSSVRIAFRIPGDWSHPGELLERIPDGFRLTPEVLVLPDGGEIEFIPMPPDDEFPQIFRSSCRRDATDEELAIVDRYTVNVGLAGPGGSLDSALTMVQAGAAIVQAGGAGVFIDNSGLAHGGRHWLELLDDGSPDALSFAFVSIVSGEREVWTMGMHVLGFPEIVMRRSDLEADAETIIEVLRYVCSESRPIGDGHMFVDENGPRYLVKATTNDEFPAGSPMHNPFGRLMLTSMKDIAEEN